MECVKSKTGCHAEACRSIVCKGQKLYRAILRVGSRAAMPERRGLYPPCFDKLSMTPDIFVFKGVICISNLFKYKLISQINFLLCDGMRASFVNLQINIGF